MYVIETKSGIEYKIYADDCVLKEFEGFILFYRSDKPDQYGPLLLMLHADDILVLKMDSAVGVSDCKRS